MKRIRPRRKKNEMNDTEARYATILEEQKTAGLVLDYDFEKIKLKLADNTFYTPDFTVTTPDEVQFHEVKGFWEDDARVKIKVAASQFWQFAFYAVTLKKGAPTKGRQDQWTAEPI
jgi:hypothetical protein